MIKYTHRKKIYHALCLQWDGTNTEMIIELLGRAGCDAHPYGDELMLRWRDDWRKGPTIEMMKVGYWLRIGEDDSLKVFSPDVFDQRYEAI